MTILSVQDLAIYVPGLDLDSPQAAILKAQMLAEGPKGAKRPLEKREFTETPRASNDGIIRLSRWPIDPDSPITVQVRGNNSYSTLGVNSFEWQTIPDDQYSVDVEVCEITIPSLTGITASQFSLVGSSYYSHAYPGTTPYGRKRQTQERFPFQVRVTYTAGFDFQADPLDPDAQEIKVALASILELQNSSFASGVKQFNITDFVSATAGADLAQLTASSQGNTLMGDYLDVFKQYCPKEYAT
ncbi:hypothetical protein Lepto7375DRAFT_7293 [Leptolyngbya sp. PCC 7375]|nr:hypothetical protein Lepto7375DRAFT_7293 [Leptolyngbya sp. PCC 7375]